MHADLNTAEKLCRDQAETVAALEKKTAELYGVQYIPSATVQSIPNRAEQLAAEARALPIGGSPRSALAGIVDL